MTAARAMKATPASTLFLLALEDASLWLLERVGAAIMSGRLVTRADLAAEYPRLLRALQAGDHKDTPRIVVDTQG